MKGADWPLFVIRMGYHHQMLTEDLAVAVIEFAVVAEAIVVAGCFVLAD